MSVSEKSTQGQKTVKGGTEKKTEWKWGQRGSLCTVDSEETLVVREGWKALIRSKAVERGHPWRRRLVASLQAAGRARKYPGGHAGQERDPRGHSSGTHPR